MPASLSRIPDSLSRWIADAGSTRWLMFSGVCVLVVIWEIYAIFIKQPGPALDVHGHRVVVLTDLGRGSRVSQSFVPRADVLTGVTLWFNADGGSAAADVACELFVDAGAAYMRLYRWIERVDVAGRAAHTFTFAPVGQSRNRPFRLDLKLVGAARGDLGLEASQDDAVRPGMMTIDGREQWGDLVFRTHSASRFRLFLTSAQHLLPAFRRPIVVLLVLVVYNWAVMALVYFMMFGEDA